METVVIVGVGPGLGLSLANRFGREGFRVVLLARDSKKLKTYVNELNDKDITAASYCADVTNESEVSGAFSRIYEEFGDVDGLIYNAARVQPHSALDTTAEIANDHLQVNTFGGIRCASKVIPNMISHGQGTIMFTGGGHTGLTALPMVTPLSIGKSALRSYVYCLHEELARKGVYVGMLSVEGIIKEGTFYAPDKIVDVYYNHYMKKDKIETFYNEENKNI